MLFTAIVVSVGLVLSVGSVNATVTCNACKGEECELGYCNGTYCVDYYSSEGQNNYVRGCYSPIAGDLGKPDFQGDGFACSVSLIGTIKESLCVCNSGDRCNQGNFHMGPFDKGDIKCRSSHGKQETGTCAGDLCILNSDSGDRGCQDNEGFTVGDIGTPASGFDGCFKIRNSSGSTEHEVCSCSTNMCNAGPRGNYRPPTISCIETSTDPEQPGTRACYGHACYLTGSPLLGFDRGCIIATGTKPIPQFCQEKDITGLKALKTYDCLCTKSDCNKDLQTAFKTAKASTAVVGQGLLLVSLLMVTYSYLHV